MIGETNASVFNRTASANWGATNTNYTGHSGNTWVDYGYENVNVVGKDTSIITANNGGVTFNVDGVMTATTFYLSDASSSNFAVGIGYTLNGASGMIQGSLISQNNGLQATCTLSTHVNAGDSIRWRIYGYAGRPNTYNQMCGATLIFISDY